MSPHNIDKLLQEVEKQQKRFFPKTPLFILERLPFYVKARITLEKDLFIEIRYNSKGKRWSYVLVKNNRRIAGFDNLDEWHMHPGERESMHKKISEPTLTQVFEYFSHLTK